MAIRTHDEQFKRTIGWVVDHISATENLTDTMAREPLYLHIEPTNACNLRCIHCHHAKDESGQKKWYHRPLGMMKWELFTKVVDEAAPWGTPVTFDTQGEPTLHPRFLDMVAYVKEKGLHLSLITNATRLDEETAKRLVDLKLDRIVFSFDAVEKEVYENIRIRSKLEPTLYNLLRFIRINHEMGHPTHVCMSTVIQDMNRDHIPAYEAFFKRLPVDKIYLNPLLNLAGSCPLADQVEERPGMDDPQPDWPVCRMPWEAMTINWDGEVGPCPVDVNVIYSVGNVGEYSLTELWNSPKMKAFRRAHLDRDYRVIEEKGPLCKSCNVKFDHEFDIRDYKGYAVNALYRNALHFAHQLDGRDSDMPIDEGQAYETLLDEIHRLEGNGWHAEKKTKPAVTS